MATKLHELLAVETNLENQAEKCRTDLAETFHKKRHLFEEKKLVFTPDEEGKPPQIEAHSEMASTVLKELIWLEGHISKAWDASFQVADANTRAKADVILDNGTVLIKDVPATALLELEKRCTEIQQLVTAIPTLDPAKSFHSDEAKGKGVFAARVVNKTRTQKQPKVIVKYEATKEHPAQTELFSIDAPIGKIEEQEWSGLITPGDKAALLDRIETLTRAVRRARSRANDEPVNLDKKFGNLLLGYVFFNKH